MDEFFVLPHSPSSRSYMYAPVARFSAASNSSHPFEPNIEK